MSNFWISFIYYFNWGILSFAVTVMSSYLILALISFVGLRKYLRANRFVNYEILLSSELAPAISLIAPAYNEGLTIEENVKSLLSLNYNNYEVIIVNDGSKDQSMELMIKAYDLVRLETELPVLALDTKPIRGVYVSRKKAFAKLRVVDKENGGKADALNAGINLASNPHVVCIDVDCILDKDALLKLAKPYLEESDKKVIATGGVVRIANSCKVRGGRLAEINVPENLLARTQVIEYLRAFLLGRMAWSRLDGLLLISGAFGMFDRSTVLAVGGYNHKTVGEDMELVVRMRRHMIKTKQAYTVAYIPDPLCWTEAPESPKVFRKQRSRWTRGTMETLWIHRKMLFNPRYKLLGLLSVPYWFFFEYLAPLVEFAGLMITLILVLMGGVNWTFFLLLVLFVYTFALLFSVFALITEELTFKQYTRMSHFSKLLWTALIEPLYFHPFTVYAALVGNWEKIKGQQSWGEMTRKGFASKP